MKYKPSRDLPLFVGELGTLDPQKIAEHIREKRNELVAPESIAMWFEAHPEICEELKKALS